jgi:hypothetical protein
MADKSKYKVVRRKGRPVLIERESLERIKRWRKRVAKIASKAPRSPQDASNSPSEANTELTPAERFKVF